MVKLLGRSRVDRSRPRCFSTSCVICGNSGCHSASRSSAAGVATGDKTMRLHAQTAMIENGFVLLPETAPWLAEYLHEMTGVSQWQA